MTTTLAHVRDHCLVYVVRDSRNQVLYVGMTGDVAYRMKAHRQTAAWWPEFDHLETFGPYGRELALRHEQELIWCLGPVYNQPHRHDALRLSFDRPHVTTRRQRTTSRT